MSNTVSIDQLRPELWQKKVWKNVMDDNFFSRFTGESENNIVQLLPDLKKSQGDRVTVPLTAKLTGNGVVGDAEREGQEEAINAYYDRVAIDAISFQVRLTGSLDEQKNAYNMRMDAQNKLSVQLKEFIERQIFLKLAGVNNTSLTDVAGNVVGTRATWSNTPAQVPTADTGAGYGNRYLCADYSAGLDSLASTDLLTPELISRAKYKAMQKQADGMPRVNPLRIDGKEHYVMFIHPWQAFDLKNNATYAQAQRDAQIRGSNNPIFSGALGMWDGVILYEHEYVPFLDISVAGNNFYSSDSGTDASADTFRALLCGQQAGIMAQTSKSMKMVEKLFNYDDQPGYSVKMIGGIQKTTFANSSDTNVIDYGVVAVDTAATSLV